MSQVLIVDDDPTIRRIAEKTLRSQGHEVLTAADGKTALDMVQQKRPDLVLLDIGLPDTDGFSVCRRLRNELLDDVPIIFLTAEGQLESRLRGFEAGAQDYITKPFSPPEMAARVGVHLNARRRQAELTKRNDESVLRERLHQDLSDMIVHDLKAPIASIQATLSLVREEGLISDKDYKHLLDNSERAAGRMLLMVNDILDVSRAETGNLEPELRKTDIEKLFRSVSKLLSPQCGRIGVELRTEVSPGLKSIVTDPELVFRVLVNLATNAVKFSPRGGEVLLSCLSKEGKALLSVSDSGPGIPDEDKELVFAKFVQARAEGTPKKRGTGIGLAFCRLAAEALGGRIRVEDREGGGSRFILELPAKGAR